MATSTTVPAQGRVRVAAGTLAREARRTPGSRVVGLGAIWLLTLLTYLIARGGLLDARTATETIGRTAEPNVVNARQIASSLTDMHAHVANAFLLGFGEHSDDWDVYERERMVVADTLALVQQDNTTSDALATARQLAEDYGTYQDRIARAAANQAQNYPVGMSYFREADSLMHQKLLPAADRLAQSSDAILKDSFTAHVSGGRLVGSNVTTLGVLLLVVLIATQVFLAVRTRRTLNPALLIAMLLAVVMMVRTLNTLGSTTQRLTDTRDGPYAAVFGLTQARARLLGQHRQEPVAVVTGGPELPGELRRLRPADGRRADQRA